LLAGRWILEFQELDSLAKAEVTAIKKCLTGTLDVFRPSYGRSPVELPRQCVFCGTVNETAYLRDSTGGRRFWPVRVKEVHVEGIAAVRDQLWAEAMMAYSCNDRWWPDGDEETALCAVEQESRFDVDEWENLIGKWLDTNHAVASFGHTTLAEVMRSALGFETRDGDARPWSERDQRRAAKVMNRLALLSQADGGC
jgi:predicted P-loop ATPase